MKSLDLNTFPLDGMALIEASAGTGKTYALANLYLRLLLEKRYVVDDILVVTFTEAATQELKERIRLRIGELVYMFETGAEDDGNLDPVLLSFYESSENKDLDLLLLRMAERQIDQSEIYTIHGFCQRMLNEYALDSALPLQQSLLEDVRPVLRQVIEDFWRTEILSLPAEKVAYIYQYWVEPEGLLEELLPIINRQPEILLPNVEGGEGDLSVWTELFKSNQIWFEKIKKRTADEIEDVTNLIAKAPLKRIKDKLKWLDQIKAWSESESSDFGFPSTSSKSNLLFEFTPAQLMVQTKANQTAPEHSYFVFLERELEDQPPSLRDAFIVCAYQRVLQAFEASKQAKGQLSFDDLIAKLAVALEVSNSTKSQHAAFLAERIQQRYGIALIDEFQDTDKGQYGIFSTLFGPASSSETKNLVLIGDPKQAIYAFRGGDIATYLLAKREVHAHEFGDLYTMDTNWRSEPKMIDAVNHLFSSTANPFKEKEIPFYPVKAGRKSSSENKTPALTITQLDTLDVIDADGKALSLKKEQITMGLANHCVDQVVGILNEGELKSADLAVLVRSSMEADLIKACLADAGISASFEGKHSIYESEEATAILFLMYAVAEPNNERLIRRCLAEPFFGLSDARFVRMKTDVMYLGDVFQIFRDLHTLWLNKGVLAMIRQALQSLEVFAHWQQLGLDTAGNQWERRLSNINQLSELLQQHARIYRGQGALTRWLQDQIFQDHSVDDDNRMRLESDEKLIRIVTIHKSKGLEYPVVFLPFLFSGRGASEAWFYREGQLCLDLSRTETHLVKADQERLAEDMRLLYVALTRAKFRCFVGTSAYKSKMAMSLGLDRTAWGQICMGGEIESLDDDVLFASLDHIASQSNGSIKAERVKLSQINQNPVYTVKSSEDTSKPPLTLSANRLSRDLYSNWRVTSFTGLMHEDHAIRAKRGAFVPSSNPADVYLPDGINILSFPKGSRAGTFLHTLFENMIFESGCLLPELKDQYASLLDYIRTQLQLAQLIEEEELSVWSEYLALWLQTVLGISLGQGFALRDLPSEHYVSEMNFHFLVEHLDASGFNSLLSEFGFEGAIEFSSVKGHLKGAIDLTLKANGKFYVVDYKSNYLGAKVEDYSREKMAEAIQGHRYDVQYLIYTLALHRYLKHRMGLQYDYDRDFGGVMYLFLRGLGMADPELHQSTNLIVSEVPGVYYTKPPKDLILRLDKLMSELSNSSELY